MIVKMSSKKSSKKRTYGLKSRIVSRFKNFSRPVRYLSISAFFLLLVLLLVGIQLSGVQDICVHSNFQRVDATGESRDVFVPTESQAEWNAFVNNVAANTAVTLTSIACCDNDHCSSGTRNGVTYTGICSNGNCVDCTTHSHCASGGSAPWYAGRCSSNKCVECTVNSHCKHNANSDCSGWSAWSCSGNNRRRTRTCYSCSSGECSSWTDTETVQCSGNTPICSGGSCVACTAHSHCASGGSAPWSAGRCVNNNCVECTADSHCKHNANNDCSGWSAWSCSGDNLRRTRTCYSCSSRKCSSWTDSQNFLCSGDTPYCSGGSCVECTADSHCSGGGSCYQVRERGCQRRGMERICTNNVCEESFGPWQNINEGRNCAIWSHPDYVQNIRGRCISGDCVPYRLVWSATCPHICACFGMSGTCC